MSTNLDIERLISRFLDDEASHAERAELRRKTAQDPAAEALFEDHAALDREIHAALRRSLGRPLQTRRPQPFWQRAGQALALGIAACLAAMIWVRPADQAQKSAHPAREQVNAASWFGGNPAPTVAPTPGDEWSAEAGPRPRPREHRWIVVPSGRSGDVLIIEMEQPRTHDGRDF